MSKKFNNFEQILETPDMETKEKYLIEKRQWFRSGSSKCIDIPSDSSGSESDSTDVSDAGSGSSLKVITCDIIDSLSDSDDGFEEISEDSTTDDEEPIPRKKKFFKRILMWAKRVLRPRSRPF
ncbi:unnamed protein product [Nezara viridula]|uniref:Uncharacterized protein n=1 Tax=Nezara viridula TaxID=85310 RepID=A0A9P0MFV1_NEZVI|nr:unnamed protein product [Nezara viridula]